MFTVKGYKIKINKRSEGSVETKHKNHCFEM